MTDEEKFINFCETADYILVGKIFHYIGTYDKESESIVYPKFRPEGHLNVREWNYEYDGEWWVLRPKNRKGFIWCVKFLNEVKTNI